MLGSVPGWFGPDCTPDSFCARSVPELVTSDTLLINGTGIKGVPKSKALGSRHRRTV